VPAKSFGRSTPRFKLDDEIEVECTFCHRKLVLGLVSGDPTALHHEPACQKFLETELLDFIVENNRRLGVPAPDEETN
jgi:hypothetical protein